MVSGAFSLISFSPSEMRLSSDLCVILHLSSAQIVEVLKQNVLLLPVAVFILNYKEKNQTVSLV